MEAMIVGYYLGLLVFALNGLVMVGQRRALAAQRAESERLRRLLLARKVR